MNLTNMKLFECENEGEKMPESIELRAANRKGLKTTFPTKQNLATESFLVTRQQKEALNKQKALNGKLENYVCISCSYEIRRNSLIKVSTVKQLPEKTVEYIVPCLKRDSFINLQIFEKKKTIPNLQIFQTTINQLFR